MLSESEIRLAQALIRPSSLHGQEQINTLLSKIIRYKGLTMIHPSNVANHQLLVCHIALNVANIWSGDMGVFCDIEPAVVIQMAKLHDDHEADNSVDDIPTYDKEKMSEYEIAQLRSKEIQAQRVLAERYYGLRVDSPEFLEYLKEKQDLENLSTLEAECTKIGDMLHAIWEVLHECLAGNESFYIILERYKLRSLKLANRSPLWNIMQYHPFIQLDQDHFPTPEQVRTMPKITKKHICEVNAEDPKSLYTFLNRMRNPHYPAWYREGFDVSLYTLGTDGTARTLFPTWSKSFFKD